MNCLTSEYYLVFKPGTRYRFMLDDQRELISLLKKKERPGFVYYPNDAFGREFSRVTMPLDDDELFRIKMMFENCEKFVFSTYVVRVGNPIIIKPDMFDDEGLVIDEVVYSV